MAKQRKTSKPGIVVVTGGAGGLGVHVVRTLEAAGWTVRALDERPLPSTGRGPLLAATERVEWVPAGLGTSEAREALEGAQAVVHCSAQVSLSDEEALLMTVNADQTRRFFDDAADAGVDHFVHISCAFVYAADNGVITEASPTAPGNPYERSKLAGERALQRAARQKGAPALTILRPGLLYGPGCTQMGAGIITLPAILGELTRLLPGLTGGPRTNWCHVEDAATSVLTVLEHPDARGAIFNVADATPLSFGEVLTSIMEAYGFELGPSVPMPNVALWAILSPIIDHDWTFDRARRLLLWAWRRVQGTQGIQSPLRPRLQRNALFYVQDDAIVVADALRELGWEPHWTDFREGIAVTIRWYQEQGWIPRFDTESLVERRDAQPSTSISYTEIFEGTFHGDDHQPFHLELLSTWRGLPVPPFRTDGVLTGTLTIDGLTQSAKVQGTMEIKWLPIPRITYEFGFDDDRGKACRIEATRSFRPDSGPGFARMRGSVTGHRGHRLGDFEATWRRS